MIKRILLLSMVFLISLGMLYPQRVIQKNKNFRIVILNTQRILNENTKLQEQQEKLLYNDPSGAKLFLLKQRNKYYIKAVDKFGAKLLITRRDRGTTKSMQGAGHVEISKKIELEIVPLVPAGCCTCFGFDLSTDPPTMFSFHCDCESGNEKDC